MTLNLKEGVNQWTEGHTVLANEWDGDAPSEPLWAQAC